MITINRSSNLKTKPTDNSMLGFGKIFTDHMFTMDYNLEKGWHNPTICPYGPIELYPSAMCLHYSQEIFEGMKAYRSPSNRILLFRPMENIRRLNESCKRMCIPTVDEEILFNCIKSLLKIEKAWVPTGENTSLYIRPFIIATTPFLGVRPADEYKLIIILSPCGNYYEKGINPINVYVETNFIRAARGGTGAVKTGGNYSASLLAQHRASRKGFDQVLWLDALQNKYVEEVGTMNVFFVLDEKIVTPALNGTILPGITRKSIIEMCDVWGIKVEERRISIEELVYANNDGRLSEAFGTGTAAVITPIGRLNYNKKDIIINDQKTGKVTQSLYKTLTDMQYGKIENKFDWVVEVR